MVLNHLFTIPSGVALSQQLDSNSLAVPLVLVEITQVHCVERFKHLEPVFKAQDRLAGFNFCEVFGNIFDLLLELFEVLFENLEWVEFLFQILQKA